VQGRLPCFISPPTFSTALPVGHDDRVPGTRLTCWEGPAATSATTRSLFEEGPSWEPLRRSSFNPLTKAPRLSYQCWTTVGIMGNIMAYHENRRCRWCRVDFLWERGSQNWGGTVGHRVIKFRALHSDLTWREHHPLVAVELFSFLFFSFLECGTCYFWDWTLEF
jgi:hypothetical protein